MAQGIIFAYSYNKFHATLTTRAQNTISAPTCVPETRLCCLKICGWGSGQPFVKSPGSSNTRPPCTYMKGKFPTPVNCLSGKFPGVSRGGGWLLQELTHALLRIKFEKLSDPDIAFPETLHEKKTPSQLLRKCSVG